MIYNEQRDPFLLTIVFDRGRLRFNTGDCAIKDETKTLMASSFGTIFEQVCESASSGFIEAITLEGTGGIDSASALKLQKHAVHRILHGGSWQTSTAEWLASAGVHARGNRFEQFEDR
jgi:hypothetical protein